MNGTDWNRVRQVFDRAMELDDRERQAYIEAACADDTGLRREVDSLMAADQRVEGFLEKPAFLTGSEFNDEHAGASMEGKRVGRYQIRRLLAEGGMGVVYLARQEQPERDVALKLIRPGVVSKNMVRRFEHEAQVLGRLRHPGIAQIYEAGVHQPQPPDSSAPVPFFAMEYVEGRTLIDHANHHNLSVRQRLELLATLCDAVEHAHQKGVIHRDLKPGNILVDASGQSKILDFGVARVTDSDIQMTTLRTDIGQLIGTLPYMSPEQVAGDPDELDTRSDVYALGVICYELLTGRLPYDLRDKAIHEAVRVIRDEDPTPMSTINRVFRGDAETIVGKALEKDRARRYQSASALGSDIRHYLHDEPIAARPASAMYQLRKFARRNRGLVGGVAAAFAVLVLGTAGTSWQAVRATRAEADARRLAQSEETQKVIAQRAAKTVGVINEFLLGILTAADPAVGNVDITVLEALDAAIDRIGIELQGEPEVEATVRETIGNTLGGIGQYEKAQVQLTRSLEIRRELFGSEHPAVASSLQNLAEILREKGDYAEAEPFYREAVTILRRQGAEGLADLSNVLSSLALLLHTGSGDFEKAESLFREALDIARQALGEDRQTAMVMGNLASVLQDQNKYDAAKDLYTEALAMRRRVLGEEHVQVASNLDNLATLVVDMGDAKKGEQMHRQALDMRRRLLPPNHPRIANSLNNVAYVLRLRGQYAEAEKMYGEALDIRRVKLGNEHPETAISLNNLADVLIAQGDFARAEPLLGEAVMIARKSLPPDHLYTAYFEGNYGECLSKLDRYEDAETQLIKSLETLRRTVEPDNPRIVGNLQTLIKVYESTDRPDKAAECRAKLRESNSAGTPETP